MGYLNKSTITVDAILTNRGRELLAKGGRDNFTITKYALADDEVDYGLYTVAHPEGSEYYGAIIENMPVLEATPDEQQIMRYKLVSLGSEDLGTNFITETGEIYIPRILDVSNIIINDTQTQGIISPVTEGASEFEESYTLIVANATFMNIYKGSVASANLLNPAERINSNGSITIDVAAGDDIIFVKVGTKTGETTATIYGDSTGATTSITIDIN